MTKQEDAQEHCGGQITLTSFDFILHQVRCLKCKHSYYGPTTFAEAVRALAGQSLVCKRKGA